MVNDAHKTKEINKIRKAFWRDLHAGDGHNMFIVSKTFENRAKEEAESNGIIVTQVMDASGKMAPNSFAIEISDQRTKDTSVYQYYNSLTQKIENIPRLSTDEGLAKSIVHCSSQLAIAVPLSAIFFGVAHLFGEGFSYSSSYGITLLFLMFSNKSINSVGNLIKATKAYKQGSEIINEAYKFKPTEPKMR